MAGKGRRWLIVVLLSAVGPAAAAASGSGGASAPATVVSGTVVLSPATPVCRIGKSCTRRLPGFTLVFSRRGTVVARTKTDSHGRYRIGLRPGPYGVSTPHGRTPGVGLAPRRIRVPVAPRATVNFTYDVWIR